MTSQNPVREQQSSLVHAIVATALQPGTHEVVRHLARVLGIKAGSQVLLVADAPADARAILQDELHCQVEAYHGELEQMPFDTHHFDAAIVATPLARKLHPVANELSRVLKPNGALGMVVLSIYRDQMPDTLHEYEQVEPLLEIARPAAAYRAVLAECGFTAFVTEDRRRDVRLAALNSYRSILQPANESPITPQDAMTQALSLMAAGSVGVALITAENGR